MSRRALQLPILGIFLALTLLLPSMTLAAPAADRAYAQSLVDRLATAEGQRDQMFAALSPKEKEAVIWYWTPARAVVQTAGEVPTVDQLSNGGDAVTPMSAGCWGVDKYVTMYANGGPVVYRYGTHYDWCGDGYAMTQKQSRLYVETPGWWWSLDSELDYWENGGVGYTGFEVFRQGKMTYCPYAVGCIQTLYPWVHSAVYGNGGTWQNSSAY